MKILIIGRTLDNDIVLDDVNVSKHHAQLLIDGAVVTIIDLDSTNGILVNGKKIQGKRVLHSFDVVQLGSTYLKWQNYISEAPPVAADSPSPQPPLPQAPTPQHVTIVHEIREAPSKKRSSGSRVLVTILVIVLAIPVLGYIGLSISGRSFSSLLHVANTIDLQLQCSEVSNLLIASEVTVIVANTSTRVHDNVSVRIVGFDRNGSQIIEKVVMFDWPIEPHSSLPKLVTLPARVKRCKCELLDSNPR